VLLVLLSLLPPLQQQPFSFLNHSEEVSDQAKENIS